MVKAGIQLYSLHGVEQPFEEILETVADAGFSGVEFAHRVGDEDPAAVAETLDRVGLTALGAHVGIDHLEDDFEETVEFYETLGCSEFVIPWLGEEHFSSQEAIDEIADRVAVLNDRLTERGISLHYHNHAHEYVDVDGRPGFHRFIDATDIDIQLDVGFALIAGDEPAARIRELGSRCRQIHLKDVDVETGDSVPLGEGDLDVQSVATALEEVGGEWLIYEYEGEDAIDTLDDAADLMAELL